MKTSIAITVLFWIIGLSMLALSIIKTDTWVTYQNAPWFGAIGALFIASAARRTDEY